MADPLRKVLRGGMAPLVTASGNTVSVDREWLECGHLVGVKQDALGNTNAARRRCHKCRRGLPQDFNPAELETA